MPAGGSIDEEELLLHCASPPVPHRHPHHHPPLPPPPDTLRHLCPQHNNLVAHAVNVNEGAEEPSSALTDAWNKAQEIRQWLTLGSADFQLEHSGEGSSSSGSSTDDAHMLKLCEEVGCPFSHAAQSRVFLGGMSTRHHLLPPHLHVPRRAPLFP